MLFKGVTFSAVSTLLFISFCYVKSDFSNQALKISSKEILCSLGCMCEGQLVYLDCTGRNVTKLPLMIQFAPETTVVSFQENLLTNISEKTFYNAMNITEINFSRNKIVQIEDYTFRSMQFLQILRLSNNKIHNLTSTTLYGLSKLRILEMSHNNLQELPIAMFVHAFNVQELKLQFNKLSSLPNTTFQYLRHLERLDLGGNQLNVLPGNLFHETPRLQTLSLAENNFEDVPNEALAHAKWLHSLDLSKNKFRIFLPGSFSNLYNITLLYLNDLYELVRIERNAFANLNKLKVLSCNYNKKLTFFHPEAFGHNRISQSDVYPSEQLLLRENGLNTLPEPLRIDSWSKLKHIDLRDNPWRCDCKIRWMTKLKRNIAENIRCESPFSIHGRTINSLKEKELICEHHWMFTSIILVTVSLLAFFTCIGVSIIIFCYNTSCGRSIRIRSQFSYKKFMPRKEEEAVDLDWDPTAIM